MDNIKENDYLTMLEFYSERYKSNDSLVDALSKNEECLDYILDDDSLMDIGCYFLRDLNTLDDGTLSHIDPFLFTLPQVESFYDIFSLCGANQLPTT